jgi:geranylgeranylglycerol-phosphate geranylgeranyltransferase
MHRYLQLIRPLNCVMSAAAVFIGGFIGMGTAIMSPGALPGVALAMLAVFLFVAAGNSLNDYEDREIDKKAHPARPVPSGKIKPGTALRLSYFLFFAAALLSAFVSFPRFQPLLLLIINLIVMLSYERRLKSEGLSGNLSIAWLTSSLFLFGAVAVDRINAATAIFIIMAFFSILGREIVKDIEDMEGDRGVRRTLPMTSGTGVATTIASFAFIVAVALSPLPYVLGLLSHHYLAIVLAADAIFIYCVILVGRKYPKDSQKYAKAGMLLSLAAFAVGVV